MVHAIMGGAQRRDAAQTIYCSIITGLALILMEWHEPKDIRAASLRGFRTCSDQWQPSSRLGARYNRMGVHL